MLPKQQELQAAFWARWCALGGSILFILGLFVEWWPLMVLGTLLIIYAVYTHMTLKEK